MVYKFSDLDEELKIIQIEKLLANKTIVKSRKIIYLKNSIINRIIKILIDKNIIDIKNYKCSEDFYIDSSLVIDFDKDEIYEDTIYDEYSFNDEFINKKDIMEIILEELDIYYLIYNLPAFNVNMAKFKNLLYVLYDYINENDKGNFLEFSTSLNRFVVANALINNKEITYNDYIKNLKYLSLYGLSYDDIENIKEKLKYKKVLDYQKYIQKKA